MVTVSLTKAQRQNKMRTTCFENYVLAGGALRIQKFCDIFSSSRVVAQIGAGLVLALLVAVSAATTVSSPQVTLATVTPASPFPSRTPSPAATATATRARVTHRTMPQAVPGQPQVDANTIVLYHFDTSDTSAVDATGQYTGTLVGNAIVGVPQLYAGVLSLDGNGSYVRTGYLGNLSEGTVEAFVDFSHACDTSWNLTILSAGGDYGSQQTVLWLGALPEGPNTAPYLKFGIFDGTKWHIADAGITACRYLVTGGTTNPEPWQNIPVRWPYETWRFHHVAGTWGPRGVEIWVDGVLHGIASTDPDPTWPYKYKCNPQDQEASPIYPLCKTPVVVPSMTPGPPPGAYYGGLSEYSTFMIGCDSGATIIPGMPSGMCFKGRIDEVRISNIQRMFTYSVVPTVTPTPTSTPQALTAEYAPDQFTNALYHFNDVGSYTAQDATGQFNGSLSADARIVPEGRFGGSLLLNCVVSADGFGTYAHLPNSGNPMAGTLEAWVKYTSANSAFAIIHGGDEYGFPTSRYFLGVPPLPYQRAWSFGVFDGTDMHWVDSGLTAIALADNCWHHVAGTWGTRGVEIWIDGTWRATNPFTGRAQNQISTYLIGSDSRGNCFVGNVDEVRMSSIQRTFTPNALGARRVVVGSSPRSLNSDYWVFLPLIFGNNGGTGCLFGP